MLYSDFLFLFFVFFTAIFVVPKARRSRSYPLSLQLSVPASHNKTEVDYSVIRPSSFDVKAPKIELVISSTGSMMSEIALATRQNGLNSRNLRQLGVVEKKTHTFSSFFFKFISTLPA